MIHPVILSALSIPHIIGESQQGEDIEMKGNEVYGVSMATVPPGQPQMQDNTLIMSGMSAMPLHNTLRLLATNAMAVCLKVASN